MLPYLQKQYHKRREKKIPLSAEKCRQGDFWGGGKEVRV